MKNNVTPFILLIGLFVVSILFFPITLFSYLFTVLIGSVFVFLTGRWYSINLLKVFIFLVFVLSVVTLKKFIDPPIEWVTNTDHYYLEHEGYRIDKKEFVLSSNDRGKQFLNFDGGIKISPSKTGGYVIKLNDAYEPLYIKSKRKKYYTLANSAFGIEFKDSLNIKSTDSAKPFNFTLLIKKRSKRKADYFIEFENGNKKISAISKFSKVINRGFPLYEIINRCDSIPDNIRLELLKLFGGAVVVKEVSKAPSVGISLKKGDQAVKKADYCFFPSVGLREKSGIQYNTDKVNTGIVSYEGRQLKIREDDSIFFYTGIGTRKTTVYYLYKTPKGSILKFTFPKKYALVNTIDTVFQVEQIITSKPEELARFKPDPEKLTTSGGYLFNYFGNSNYNISARIKYTIGSSNAPLNMSIIDNNGSKKAITKDSGQFTLSTDDKNVTWLLGFHNSKAENPIKRKYLFGIIAMLWLFSFIIFNNRGRKTHLAVSKIEGVIYIIVFAFVVVRLILSYRITTFFPFNEIDTATYQYLIKNSLHWFKNFFLILLIFLIIWTLFAQRDFFYSLRYLFNNKKTSGNILLFLATNKKVNIITKIINILIIGGMFVAPIAVSVFKLTPPESSLTRLLNIFIPIIGYFIIVAIISPVRLCDREEKGKSKVCAPMWKIALLSGESTNIFIANNKQIILFILSLVTFFTLAITDSGYALLFAFYLLLKILFSYSTNNKWKTIIVIIILGSIFYYMLSKQGQIIYWFTQNPVYLIKSIYAFLTFIALALAIRIFLIRNPRNRYQIKRKKKTLIIAKIYYPFFLFIIVLSSFFYHPLCDYVSNKTDNSFSVKSAKYRAGIMIKHLDELIEDNNYNSKDYRLIMRSVQNQWLIHHFWSQSNDSNSDGFYLQPNTNKGASYILQTTDVIIPRYLIAEHGEKVVLLLLMLLLLPIYIIIGLLKNTSISSFAYGNIILSIFILLFSTAFFVWMTSTNKLTFFGQDFPLISVTSAISMYLYLTLLLIIIFLARLLEKSIAGKTSEKNGIKQAFAFDFKRILVILLVPIIFIAYLSLQNPVKVDEEHYDLKVLLSKLRFELNILNYKLDRFQEYHNTNGEKINTSKIVNYLGNNIKNDSTRSAFVNGALQNFVANINTPFNNEDQIVYLKRRNNHYRLVANNSFFPSPPVDRKTKWFGKLLAARTKHKTSILNGNIIINKNRKDNIVITPVPRDWTTDSAIVYIIRDVGFLHKSSSPQNKYPNKHFKVYKGDTLISSRKFDEAVPIYVGNEIEILKTNQAGKEISVQSAKYNQEDEYALSKSLWVNGKQKIFYPLGQSFPWSVSFSNLVSDYFEDSIAKLGSKKQLRNQVSMIDVKTTIDYELTKKLDSILYSYVFKKNKTIYKAMNNFLFLDFNDKLKYHDEFTLSKKGNKYLLNGNGSLVRTINRRLEHNKHYNADSLSSEQNLILNDAIKKAISGNFNFAVVGVDGDGKIRFMVDRNKQYRPDPNSIANYYRYLSMLSQFGSSADERDIVGNKNLLRIPRGVGSTFKPIVYSAVTSQVKLNWRSLQITLEKRSLIFFGSSDNPGYIRFYAGKMAREGSVNNWFKYGHSTNKVLKPENYLPHSNNIYHSLIIFLGSFPQKQLQDHFVSGDNHSRVLFLENSRYFSLKERKPVLRRKRKFPYLLYNGSKYCLTWDWPPLVNASTPLSLGIESFYDIKTMNPVSVSSEWMYQKYVDSFSNKLFNYGSKSNNSQLFWSFPEVSRFVMADRDEPQVIIRDKLSRWLYNPSLGGAPIAVTPLKMAQSGLRLYKFDNSINVTVIDDTSYIQKARMNFIDPSWKPKELFKLYQDIVYKGMSRVTYENHATAHGLKNSLDLKTGNVQNSLDLKTGNVLYNSSGSKFYIYAKTGTQGESRSKKSNLRDKYLLVCITNKPIHQADYNHIVGNPDYKVYSLFISIQDIKKEGMGEVIGSAWGGEAPKAIIKSVINSKTFINYMAQ